MLSYSDMMTNLLCFFILMVALANRREAGFVTSGIGSHLEKIEALGLPGLMPSTRTLIPKDSPLARYKPPRVDPLNKENWVEHTQKMMQEEFDRLNDGESSYEKTGKFFPIPLGITFSSGSSRLTLKDRRDLDHLVPTMREAGHALEVIGTCTAKEAPSFQQRTDLSLQRAVEVVRYLTRLGIPADQLMAIGSGIGSIDQEASGGASSSQRKAFLRWMLPEEDS